MTVHDADFIKWIYTRKDKDSCIFDCEFCPVVSVATRVCQSVNFSVISRARAIEVVHTIVTPEEILEVML